MDLKGQKKKGEGVATKQSDFAVCKLGDWFAMAVGKDPNAWFTSVGIGLVSIFVARHCTSLLGFIYRKKKNNGLDISLWLSQL